MTRRAYAEKLGHSFTGARHKKGNCTLCNAEGYYRIGFQNLLYNGDGTLHDCEWENPVEDVKVSEIDPELIKQYESGANEPILASEGGKMSQKHYDFLTYRKAGYQYKKIKGRHGSGLKNYKRYWGNKLKEEQAEHEEKTKN